MDSLDAQLAALLQKLSIPAPAEYVKGDRGYFTGDLLDIALRNEDNVFVNRIDAKSAIVWDHEVRLGKRSITKTEDKVLIRYYSLDDWIAVKHGIEAIQHLDAVPPMTFPEERVVLQHFVPGTTLYESDRVNDGHRRQLVAFLIGMNRAGYAHRDLHCKNIIISGDDLFVIDWDFITPNRCHLQLAYDLTGQGLVSPHRSGNTSIFKRYPTKGIGSVADYLKMTHTDLPLLKLL